MVYREQLAQRKQAAADLDALLVAHFGHEAENCANWGSLWRHGWTDELVNPFPTGRPIGLPRNEDGHIVAGWVDEDESAFEERPSLYSSKFLYHLARQLADDEVAVVSRMADRLEYADGMSCEALSGAVSKILSCLGTYNLHYLPFTGHLSNQGLVEPERLKTLFHSWDSKKEATGVLLSLPDIAISNQRFMPATAVTSTLQAVRRHIDARQQQLQREPELLIDKEAKGSKLSLPSVALKLIYEDNILQRGSQANSIAREAGHTSGDSLYNAYCHYFVKNNRLGFDNDTARKGRNMINRIQAVIPHLNKVARQLAENEVSVIEARIS